MTQPEQQASSARPRKSSADRWVKLGFLVVLLGAGAAVYWLQRKTPDLSARWSRDLDATLVQARQENVRVLVFLHTRRADHDTRRMISESLKHDLVLKAVERRKCLQAVVEVEGPLSPDLAKRYNLKSLPAVVVLSPEGKVLVGQEGFVGPADIQGMLVKTDPPAPT